nr:glycosyl hydrolase family 17 protein [uncultured Psychroserpens sp.]
MRKSLNKVICILTILLAFSCNNVSKKETHAVIQNKPLSLSAKQILENPKYLAISYGGYRKSNRDIQPTIAELKDDMKILSAMGIKILRTYNVHLDQASNILKAIDELKREDPNFEMYVMLGIWIDCKNAFNWDGEGPNHDLESKRNPTEVETAVSLAQQYPDIVKILAVGNEAMVRWATAYYVQPKVILKWVNYLQELKTSGKLSNNLWITCSDDYASWGGGDPSYKGNDLEKIIKAVDYVSTHTYPYHNSHYNPEFWTIPETEQNLSDLEKVDAAMLRALEFAKKQYRDVSQYVKSIDSSKTIHIGETGWATISNGYYGKEGSRATDEYKQNFYYKYIREWTANEGIACFYFEAFDEKWKDSQNPEGSENHFGLFTIDGKAKYPLWDLVDKDVFKGLTRNGNAISKTYNGDKESLLSEVLVPNTNYKR